MSIIYDELNSMIILEVVLFFGMKIMVFDDDDEDVDDDDDDDDDDE